MRGSVSWLVAAVAFAGMIWTGGMPRSFGDSGAPKLVLSKDTAKGLQEYQEKIGSIGTGYFAVSPDGTHWAYRACSESMCNGSRSAEKAKALQNCQRDSGGVKCLILAQDQDVLLLYQVIPVPLTDLADPSKARSTATSAAQSTAATERPAPPPMSQRARPEHPGWLVDQTHGCWVWDRSPDEGDVVTWTGACAPNGPATGKGLLEWPGQERYAGEMNEGRKNGHGKLVASNGEQYEGDFKDGSFNGSGDLVWSDGASYEGGFTDDLANGTGVFKEGDEVYSGQWKMGCFDDGKKKYSITMHGKGGCAD